MTAEVKTPEGFRELLTLLVNAAILHSIEDTTELAIRVEEAYAAALASGKSIESHGGGGEDCYKSKSVRGDEDGDL